MSQPSTPLSGRASAALSLAGTPHAGAASADPRVAAAARPALALVGEMARGLELGGEPAGLGLEGAPDVALGRLVVEPEDLPINDIFKTSVAVSTGRGALHREVKSESDLSRPLQTVVLYALNQKGRNLENIINYDLNIFSDVLTVEITNLAEPPTKSTLKIDLLALLNDDATPPSFKNALKEIKQKTRAIKGYEGRFVEESIKANQRSVLHTKKFDGHHLSTQSYHVDIYSKMNIERFAETGSVFVANEIAKILGPRDPAAPACESLSNIYKNTKSKRQTILAALKLEISNKKSVISLTATSEPIKERLEKEIKKLEKLLMFFGESFSPEIQNLADAKTAMALYINQYNAPNELSQRQKEGLAKVLGTLFTQDKVNTWFQRFWVIKNQLFSGNIYGIKQGISAKDAKETLEKSSLQLGFETVSLLFNTEKDSEEKIVRDDYMTLAKKLNVSTTRKDASDVIYETLAEGYGHLDLDYVNQLLENFDLQDLDLRDRQRLLDAFNKVEA